MINKTLQWAADILQVPLLNPNDASLHFHGVSTDTRTLEESMLYVPLIGARFDGHDLLEKAKEAGACAALWQRDHTPLPEGFPLILVENTVQALEALAHAYLQTLHCQVIGITGSNGKTSVKDMTAAILSKEFKTQKTTGNRNTEIGLPLTIFSFDEDIEKAVLEMGMENFGEIAELCRIAPPDLAVIVSIGSAHMETLKSRLGIAQAKCEILDGLKAGGTFIYDAESPEIAQVLAEKKIAEDIRMISFGKGGDLFLEKEPVMEKTGMVFEVPALDPKPFSLPVAGRFQANNAMAAAAAALAAGASMQAVHEGLAGVQLTPMRGQILGWKNAVIIDDTYKSNPESAAAGLKLLMQIPAKVHAAVLADMLDLGPKESDLHRQIGEMAKDLGVDLLYAYGKRSEYTAQGFGQNAVHVDDKSELPALLAPLKEQDCAILIKGSRSMAMDTVVRALLESEKD